MNTMATEVVFCANCSHKYVLSGSDECVAIGRPEKAIFLDGSDTSWGYKVAICIEYSAICEMVVWCWSTYFNAYFFKCTLNTFYFIYFFERCGVLPPGKGRLPKAVGYINFAVLGKKNRNLGKFHLPKHVKCSGLLGQKLHFAFLGKALLP